MKNILLILILFGFTWSNSLLAQNNGSSCASALQLYPAPAGDCNNTSGPQYAGQYQCESGDCINFNFPATAGTDGTCTSDNDATQVGTWLKFVATANNATITNMTDYAGPGAADVEKKDYVVFSGSCGSLTQIACYAEVPNGGSNTVTGLTTGQTYYIWVTRSAASIAQGGTANAAATCLTSTVPYVVAGDACSNATVLTTNVTLSSTNANATSNGPICSGSVENDVWYQWCAPSNWPIGQTAYINVNNQVCNSTSGLQLTVWNTNNTCPTLSTDPDVVCQNPGATTNYYYTWTPVAGNCYYITLDGFAATACSYDITVGTNIVPACYISGNPNVCVGLTTQLTGSSAPAASNPWVSSNTAIATVSNTGLVTGVSAGTVTITFTTSTGCVATASITVSGTPTISGTNSVCVNGTTTLTGSGTPAASNPYTSSNTSVATVSASGVVTGISAGTATITYTNAGGCSQTILVTVNPLPTITGTLSACVNATQQLTGSATPNVSSPWTSSDPGVATVSNTGLVTAVSAGTTTITYTNSNGCSQTATFTVNALPIISGDFTLCVNETNVYSATTTGTATPWSSSNPAVATVSNSGLVTAVSAGTSNITFTNTNGCSSSQVVTVNALPTFTVAGASPSTCNGSNGSVTLSGLVANTSYTVSYNDDGVPVGPLNLTSNASGQIVISSTLNAGTYDNITVTNANGCSTSNAAGVSLTNPGAPDVQDVANQIICDGSFTLPAVVVTGTATSSGYFSGPNGTGTPIAAGTTFSGTTDTLIYIYAVNGPCTDQENFTIVIDMTPAINNPGALAACDSIGLPTITGTNLSGNESYYTDSQLNGGVPTTGPITNSGSVYIFDQNGTCSSEISFNVTITPTPELSAVATQTACDQLVLGAIQGNFLSGTQDYYSDSQANGGVALSSLTLTTSQTVYVYDNNNGCSDETSFDVVINQTPQLDTPNDTTVCGQFVLPVITGTNLSGAAGYFNGPQISNPSQINGSVSSSQTVYIYDENGTCSDETLFQVTVLNGPILNVPATVTACDSYDLPTIDGLNLSGNQNYYTNSQAQGGGVLTGPVTSSGWIYVYDSNGTCGAEDSTFVTIDITPSLVTTDPSAVCAPNTVDLTVAAVTNGSTNLGGISYFTDAGATSALSNPNAVSNSGTYYLVSSNNACSDTASVLVTVNALDVATTGYTNYCEGSTVIPSISGQTGGTFTFTNPVTDGATIDASTGVITNGVGGTTYTVSYTTNGLCPIVTDATVTVYAIPNAPVMSNDTTYCSAQVKVPMTAQGSNINWYLNSNLNPSVSTGNSYNPVFSESTVFYATQTVNGCESPADSIVVTIQTCGITIPTAFTPNGDQIHDTWELNNLDLNFPKNVVYIYDRWGSLIFQSEEGKYNANPWNGTYKEKELPVGSYYFIIEYNDEATENDKGTVSIIKN